MSAVISSSELQRSSGVVRIGFKRRGAATVLERLHQGGCGKVRLPRVHDLAGPEAVLLNTAGGLTGGDRFEVECNWRAGTRATVTTQAAERIYRSAGGVAAIANRLHVGKGAVARWLPQETILFDGGRTRRAFEVDLESGASLVAVESWMVGRHAMGETVRSGEVRDSWRIRREGALLFADTLRLEGDIEALLARPATAQGLTCIATLLVATPEPGPVRDLLRPHMPCTAMDGIVLARVCCASAQALRKLIGEAVGALQAVPPFEDIRLPRVWHA